MNSGCPPEPLPRRARQLNAVRRIEDHRPSELPHDDETAHIDDQVVISERRSALGQDDVVVARRRDLLRRVPHVLRRDELALLDVDDLAGPAGRDEQVRLPAEECRDLQDVDRLGGQVRLRRLMDVGEDLKALPPQSCQDAQSFLQAGSAIRDRHCCDSPCRRKL